MQATLSHYTAKAKHVLGGITETLFPPRCPLCRESVARHGALCSGCWRDIHFITDPMCFRCGLPFEFRLGEEALCGRCMVQPPAYRQARAVFRYNDASRKPVLALKYYDQTQLAPIFGEWLARAAAPFVQCSPVIVPVPLHPLRLLGRRYNQAALLAHALAKKTRVPLLPDTLRRKRATPAQSGLTRRQREDNVRGAFVVPKEKRTVIKGKTILLIDDVLTTGATLDACARALHDAGAVDVYALTLARTVIAE